jgi:hypothetical protein
MKRLFYVVLLGLCLTVALPVVGTWARRQSGERCALDGAAVDPAYRVRVLDDAGRDKSFCCVVCAELWLKHAGPEPVLIRVTDESSGEEIDARDAVFVRSSVVTRAATGNRVHTFRQLQHAERHVHQFGGAVLPSDQVALLRAKRPSVR